MVFESLVVDLMNKYLGEYIENLDSSQLKLGIWGGDAVLENLHVKGDALETMVFIETLCDFLFQNTEEHFKPLSDFPQFLSIVSNGKLTLKIPWKNLYKEAVEATLDGLYLLAVPNAEIEYDPKKEAKRQQEAKQAQLKVIEDQQLKSKQEPPQDKQDSFVEKLATQVVKNLQIHIRNIHVRYEDKITIKDKPFSFGVTLHSLSFETTNENWVACLLDESIKIIYKMVDLQCLSVYWNPIPQAFLTDSSREKQLQFFKESIASVSDSPKGFNYIIKPITLQVRLRLNPHPKSDLSTPKIVLAVLLQEIGLRVMHVQYHGIMELVESLDRMAVNSPFRKYKPLVPLRGNASLWWKYAYNSVLSTGMVVNPGKWSWSNIKAHKKKIREYKASYKEKLQQKKPPKALTDKLIVMENDLDIFNITLARQTAEVELAKAGRQIRSKQSVHQLQEETGKGGWFSGLFGKKKEKKPEKKDPEPEEKVEKKGLDGVMTPEEKRNFYLAIGYSENEKFIDTSSFEKSYIGLKLNVDLRKVSVELSDRSVSDKDILSLSLNNVSTVIEQRPAAGGLGVTAHMSSFTVDGLAQGDFVPRIVSSNAGALRPETNEQQHLLTVLFELKPLDETCDQRIVVDSQPLQIVYDAKTINSLIDFVKPPGDVQLQQLRAVAASAYDDIKEQTATGLQHVMSTKSVVEIGIRLSSSYVVIPHGGKFESDVDCLVVDLGELSFRSSNDGRVPLVKQKKAQAYVWTQQETVDESLDLEEMRSQAYDNFNIDLSKIQLLFARKGENWKKARLLHDSPMLVLQPLNISVLLQKCMVMNDAALPKLKISGEIPSLRLRVSDLKLRDILALVESIPLPTPTPEEQATMLMVQENWQSDRNRADLKVLNKALAGQFTGSTTSVISKQSSTSVSEDEFYTAESDFWSDVDDSECGATKASPARLLARQRMAADAQMTNLKLSFCVKEVIVVVTEELPSGNIDLLSLNIYGLSLSMSARTWDTTIGVYLQSISLQVLQFMEPSGKPLFLINSSAQTGSEHLLHVEIVQVKRQSPDFNALHNRTEQKLVIQFGTLNLSLHAQALLQLIKFSKKLSSLQDKPEAAHADVCESQSVDVFYSATDVVPEVKPKKAPVKSSSPDQPIINLLLEAELDCIEIAVMDQKRVLTNLQIRKVKAGVTITPATLKVKANLQNLLLTDAAEGTLYKNIISSVGKQDVLSLELTNYNEATKNPIAFQNMKVVDTSIRVRFGSTKVIFLNKFVQGLVKYGEHFAEVKDVAATAGAVAQEKAAAKAQEIADSLKASNPRVQLDVIVYAPTVLIPTHSNSRQAIIADLGTITVVNKFLGTRLLENFAVTDQMMVQLRDMKISSCTVDESLKVTNETRILQEVTLSVEIVRNLTSSWYHDVPDVSVSGHMPPISIKLSQPDMVSVMEVVSGNLNEGKPDDEVVEVPAQKATQIKDKSTEKDTSATEIAKPAVTKVWETLKVNFVMKDLMIELFFDAERKQPLSKLDLQNITANVCMRNDQSMDIDFVFGELALNDTRITSVGGITKLIRNRTQEKNVKLISAKVIQKRDGSTMIDGLVSGISIIISVEFMMKLATFFMDAMPAKPEVEAPVMQKGSPDLDAVSKLTLPAPDIEEEPLHSGRSKAVTVRFKLEEPEIVLVTDVKSLDAEAIVLGLKLSMDFDMTPDGMKQMISATLSDLQLNGCPFKCVLKKNAPSSLTHKQILAPCKIMLAGLITKTVQDFDVRISDIRIKASPVIINTISDIAAELSPPPSKEKMEKTADSKQINPLTIWTTKKISAMNFWFMKESSGSSVDLTEESSPNTIVTDKQENAKVSAPLLQITLEAGSGHHTVPLLIAQVNLKGHVSDWSGGELSGQFTLTLGTAYFNDARSVWEPLIEPTEVDPGALVPKHEPWELVTTIQQRKATAEDSENADLPPLMSVSLESKNILQTTISTAALKVIKELGIAFKDAALSKRFGDKKKTKHSALQKVQSSGAAIVVDNNLGCEIHVDLGPALTLAKHRPKVDKGYLLQARDHLLLDYVATGDADLWSILSSQESKLNSTGTFIYVHIGTGNICSINVSQAGATFHMMTSSSGTLPFVAEVTSFAGVRTVVLRSHVVLFNHLSVNLEVFKMSDKNGNTRLGTIVANDKFSIPPQIVGDHAINIKPVLENRLYDTCELSWKEALDALKTNFHREMQLRCPPKLSSEMPVFLTVDLDEEKDVDRAEEVTFDEPGINVHLHPTVAFTNYLPFSVQVSVSGVGYNGEAKQIEAGGLVQILDAQPGKSKLKVKFSYTDVEWISDSQLDASCVELSPWPFTESRDPSKSLTLAKHIKLVDGVINTTIYSPYWMLNKTGLTLDYKPSDVDASKAIQHPEKGQDVVLFSYTSKSFLSKNKLQTRVCNSMFSDSFSLDTVGSSGAITCKTKKFNYMLGTQISLTSFSLTKVITFTSFYSIHNKSDLDIEIAEFDAKPPVWLNIESGQQVDFWPERKDFLIARLKDDQKTVSTKFRYNKLDSGVLLKLGNHAVFVEVSVTEMSIEVSMRNYFEGASAVLVVNDTSNLNFECWQGKSDSRKLIEVGDACHVIWSDPTIRREITWSSSVKKDMTMDVFQEQSSSFIVSETNKTIYFVLFVDGLQRTLIFTENEERAKLVEASIRLERSLIEVNLSLHGISCSLTDTTAHREVAFVAITSSGLVWEEKPKKRWSPLAVKYSQLLEASYQNQLQGSPPEENLSLDKYTFDLKKMQVVKPNSCPLQRSFSPGLWVQFTSTPHQMTVHAKVNKVQVDNQLSGAIFPVVLNPVPLPKSIAIDSTPKPFVEVSIMQRNSEKQTFTHMKYFKVLVQEFAVKVDMGFLNALIPLFGAGQTQTTPEQELKYFKQDLDLTIVHDETPESSSSTVNFFDILHLSPIKVHVSFSMQDTLSGSQSEHSRGAASDVVKLPFTALSVVLKSIGVTVSDIDDVVFKLAYFERKYQFFSSSDFSNAVTVHYAGQAIKQLYVLVFGLDVIGNPYGLVMGIAEGVTDLFYEPYQGMIQGPGEFFEGLGLGALSLLGHTVGGAAGAVSKVTGALGKGIATITMDDEFKKKRLEDKSKPADIKEGLARGGKGLVMGVFSGVTGVVTKPIEGAKKDGAAGFFKGVGKGLIGVVARPVSGVVDLASNTFEGIQRVADMSEDVRRIRPARWIDPHTGILQPYSLRRAQGAAILEELENGKFSRNNRYVDHVPLKPDRKSVLMITNHMIISAHTGDILGQWKTNWKCTYLELTETPQLSDKTIKFFYKKRSSRSSVKKLKLQVEQTSAEAEGHRPVETTAQQIEKVFQPLSRAFSWRKAGVEDSSAQQSKNPFASFTRGVFGRSNTIATPTVHYSGDRSNLRMAGSVYGDNQQTKTKSFFGMKSSSETVNFHDSKYAEYIMTILVQQWSNAKAGSVSSFESTHSDDR